MIVLKTQIFSNSSSTNIFSQWNPWVVGGMLAPRTPVCGLPQTTNVWDSVVSGDQGQNYTVFHAYSDGEV